MKMRSRSTFLVAAGVFCSISLSALAEPRRNVLPPEFETQVLEPTGGKIPRPRAWFYSENHHGPVYLWTISREDTTGGKGYITGVRIQTLVGVQKGTGKSPKEFVMDFLAQKAKTADKVLKKCPERDQGLFTRICIETEEANDHILYSLFWGTNNMDVVVVSIAGTTKDLWSTYSPVFDKMSAFELIDMKRFQK